MGNNLDLTTMLGAPETVTCPRCKKEGQSRFDDYDVDGGQDPNPAPGLWRLGCYCRECGHSWVWHATVEVILNYDSE